MTKSKEWLLYNAVLAWLHHYELNDNASEFADQYKQLAEELKNEQSINPQTQKRGRPAKRQRTKKATSNTASTKENQTTNQEA